METVRSRDLRVLVVWVPILPQDNRAAAVEASRLIGDRRAEQFWDARGASARAFGRTLSLPHGDPAWDVYLLYPPDAEAAGSAPEPAYWQQQLGIASAPALNGNAMAVEVRKVLRRSRRGHSSRRSPLKRTGSARGG